MSNTLDTIDFKLTKKQEKLLDVLSDPNYAKETNRRKAELAGISEESFYLNLKKPNFIQALRVRGLSEAITLTVPIVKRMGLDALNSKFMQQKTLLEIGGLIQQNPFINVIINSQLNPSDDVDNKIIEKIIDITPETSDKSVDNSKGQ